MTATLHTTLNITRDLFFRMAVFAWGFIWLLMSVLIFLAGRFIPQLQSKPPPLAPLPRLPSTRSAPASPILSSPKSIASEPDEIPSGGTSFSGLAQPAAVSTQPDTPPRKLPPKKKWSLPTRFFPGRSAPSPKSSLFSEGSVTLVGSPSSTRFFPDLPMVESGTPTSEAEFVLEPAGSSRSSPTSTPRLGRGMRLPGAKVLKSLSRKMTSKKPEMARNLSHSPRVSEDVLPSRRASFDYEESAVGKDSRADTIELSKHARPGHQRQISLPGEVFSSSFVNPFRSKSRKPKAPPALDLSDPASSSPKRSTTRRMLTSFQLALSSSSPQPNAQFQSRRSSVSSTSTAVSAFSAPSVLSGQPSSPRTVPRTQPYAAPYFAPMPRSSRPAAAAAAKEHERDLRKKRASSLSPPRRPETVAEESAEEPPTETERGPEAGDAPLSALGLKLGQLGHGRPRSSPREGRVRVAVSEGTVRMASSAQGR